MNETVESVEPISEEGIGESTARSVGPDFIRALFEGVDVEHPAEDL